MNRDFMTSGDEMFEIIRRVREDHSPVIEKWKEHTMSDRVFRKDGYLYFCRKLVEPEFEIIPWEDEETQDSPDK